MLPTWSCRKPTRKGMYGSIRFIIQNTHSQVAAVMPSVIANTCERSNVLTSADSVGAWHLPALLIRPGLVCRI